MKIYTLHFIRFIAVKGWRITSRTIRFFNRFFGKIVIYCDHKIYDY